MGNEEGLVLGQRLIVVVVILALLVQAEVPVYTKDNAIEIPVCESI